jgi:virulence factor
MMPEVSGAPSTFRVAFIGAGTFANRFHFASLSRMPDVQIVAIAELNEQRLNETADTYNVPGRYTDYHRMLSEVEADAVYVIMNPQYLLPIALDVIRAGKNIFTEKPAGVDANEARQLAEAAARYGVKSGVGTNRRYSAVLRKAREEVAKQGPISTVVAEFHKDMTESYFGENILYFDGLHVVDPTYGYFTENREFVNNVRAGRDGETNLAEHLKTLELCERIHNGDHVERLRA